MDLKAFGQGIVATRLPSLRSHSVSKKLINAIGMVRHDLEQEIVLELYTGLFLMAISIGYLMVRFARTRSAPGSRSNPTSTTLRRSALVAGAILKPWGW